MPARTAEARLSTASGHTSASSRCRRTARPDNSATGRYPASSPNAAATVTVWDTTSTTTKATTAVIAHTAQTLPTVVPGSPARSSRSRVRPARARPARTGGGVVKADQSRTSPPPNPSPSSTPMSGPAVQQPAHVDADPVVEVRAVRHPLAAHQPVAAALEDRLGLDHVALDPSGHRDDLLHPTYPIGADGQMHHQVDGGGD